MTNFKPFLEPREFSFAFALSWLQNHGHESKRQWTEAGNPFRTYFEGASEIKFKKNTKLN